ncbi:hypothetical protein P692DRAFT_201809737, partial [Suillus brevipes Sb2]
MSVLTQRKMTRHDVTCFDASRKGLTVQCSPDTSKGTTITQTTVEKENSPPAEICSARDSSPSPAIVAHLQIELDTQHQKTKTYERHYRSERKRASRKDNAAACLQEQLHSLQASASNIAAGAQVAEAQLADTLQCVNRLKVRNETLTKRNHALTMRAAKHHVIEKTRIHSTEATTNSFALKEKGIFTDTSRAMVRNMVATLDVPIWSVNATINAVAEALSVEITGSVSGHSIRRIVAEGGVAAEAQLVDEMNIAKGVTLSGDATSHKNINYQSHHVTYSMPDGHAATRFAGILHEVNHKSETQLQGWKSRITDMYDTYNDVVGGTASALDVRDFPSKREVRGERALATLPPDGVVHLLWEMTESLVNEAGGIDGWDRLGVDEQQRCYSNAHHNLLAQIGQEQFDSLPQSKKDDIDFFVWAGCCMHKELNAAKGGNSRMRAWWIDNSVEGPVLLMNKDNVAASSAGSSTAKQHAIQVSTGGAQKVLELAGAVFRHKDDKKGQQDSLCYYFEVELGYRIQWPDTSNTRYHSVKVVLKAIGSEGLWPQL